MTGPEWRAFLEEWSRELLASPDSRYYDLPAGVAQSGWMGFAPATPEQIARAESRLGLALPPSYRAFLATSNGWRQTGTFVDRIVPVDEIERLATHHCDVIDGWRWSPDFAFLDDAVALSESTQPDIYLLNPRVVDGDGEYEAWIFGTDDPKAFPSFAALMVHERDTFRRVEAQAGRTLRTPDDVAHAERKLDGLLDELEKTARTYAQIALYRQAAAVLNDAAERVRALQRSGSDAQSTIAQLRAMADEADAEARKRAPVQGGARSASATFELAANFLRGGGAGQGPGYLKVAGIIRWFLAQ
ncbi:hypothetical protein WPS_03430 [Vulcanimicrobium alpinum]|uniref:Knr4/Smi1-like domain-containing protein n=1 Tax=Vulcanimicrobium alpinum TaxID=3016050 RepID=A0AAN2C8Z6_UNVUL|nr:SMI1/KNR4 family protein [Vulcanimicrobium alpinum]BDE05067.1 hypothetical protein WPS_03430 [Vulcanimicrobium alpinum]